MFGQYLSSIKKGIMKQQGGEARPREQAPAAASSGDNGKSAPKGGEDSGKNAPVRTGKKKGASAADAKKPAKTIGEEIAVNDTYVSVSPEADSSKAKMSENNAALMRIEKIEGKLENIVESKNQMTQKILDLSERIGEIRSMVLERERKINDIEVIATKTSDVMGDINPAKIAKKMEKIDSRISGLEASLEKNGEIVSAIREDMSRIKDKMSKVGDFEALSQMHKTLSKVSDEINDKRKEVYVLSSKIESMFGELSDRFPELDSIKSKLDTYIDVLQDTLKDVDKFKIQMDALKGVQDIPKKMGTFAEKKDIDALKEDVGKKISAVVSEIGSLSEKSDGLGKRIREHVASEDMKYDPRKIADIGKRLDMMEAEMQNFKQSENMDANINRVLAEYEKISDKWKWEADSNIKTMNSRLETLAEKMVDVAGCVEEIKDSKDIKGRGEDVRDALAKCEDLSTALKEKTAEMNRLLQRIQSLEIRLGEAALNQEKKQQPEMPFSSDLEGAINDINAGMTLIEKRMYSDAAEKYRMALNTYMKMIASKDVTPVTRIGLVEVYGGLKRIQCRLKNEGGIVI